MACKMTLDPARREIGLLYRKISNDIVDGISNGTYPVGSLLPTEQAFCERYSVSRYTVREAIRYVQSLGLVSRRQGQGTQVRRTQVRRNLKLTLRTFSDIEQHGYFTHLVDARTEMIKADASRAAELPCTIGDRFALVRGFRKPVDDSIPIPIAWNHTFIIAPYAEAAKQIEKIEGPVYRLLERLFDERVNEIEQDTSAILLDAMIAKKLEVRPRTAGLRIKRTYFGKNMKPIMFGYNVYAGDQFTLNMRMRHD
jgi:DNA-binding GntR family transcriptional regulator